MREKIVIPVMEIVIPFMDADSLSCLLAIKIKILYRSWINESAIQGSTQGRYKYIYVYKLYLNPVLCLVIQSCSTCVPMDCSPSGSSVHGDSPGKNTSVGCHALLHGSFQSRDQTQVSWHCRWISLPTEPPGKPLTSRLVILEMNVYGEE